MLVGCRSKMKKTLYYIPAPYKLVVYVLVILALSPKIGCGQNAENINYRQIFGDKYATAVRYLEQQWIRDTLSLYDTNACFAKSVVFPEVIRYSAIQDDLQLRALYTLYVQYGDKYADFSVGQFQMKPSFALQVENDALKLSSLKNDKNLIQIDTSSTSKARLARIKRLETPAWQLLYVVWFIKIAENKFSTLSWKNEAEKLQFIATAYNCGYNRTSDSIRKFGLQKRFYITLFKNGACYNYADVCYAYFHNCHKR